MRYRIRSLITDLDVVIQQEFQWQPRKIPFLIKENQLVINPERIVERHIDITMLKHIKL